MVKIYTTLLFLIFTLTACAQQSEISYDDFLKKHTAAMGGAASLESLYSIETKVIITEDINPITKDGIPLNGLYRANRDGQMRVDIYVDGNRVFTEALSSANDGWQQDGEGEPIEPLSDAGKAALQKSIHSNVYSLHELPELDYEIEFLGIQELMGKKYYAIDVTSPSNKVERQFFDMKTFLRYATMDESALHVDVDPTKILSVSTNRDYRNVNGIMRSFAGAVIDIRANRVMQTSELLEIEFNKPQNKEYFLIP